MKKDYSYEAACRKWPSGFLGYKNKIVKKKEKVNGISK